MFYPRCQAGHKIVSQLLSKKLILFRIAYLEFKGHSQNNGDFCCMQLKGILKVQENKKTNCRVQCNHKEPVKYFIKIMTVMRTNLKT